MKKLYQKLTQEQKSTLNANAVHWKRVKIETKMNNQELPIRTLFYKPNIKDY